MITQVEVLFKIKKKWLGWFFFIFIVLAGAIYALNLKATTSQGVNYKWQTIEIPLYLKLLDFFDRHYNYKWTVSVIIGDSKTEKEKVLKIFKWTYEKVKNPPQGYPVIDDHVWHIIVRGHGTDDQSSDVFTTLCHYAGINAFFSWIYREANGSRMPLSFINIDGKWNVFDPYNGVYFKNKDGGLASIEDIIKNDWVKESTNESGVDYAVYMKNLLPVKETRLSRSSLQSPINRALYEIRKWLQYILN